MNQEAKASIAHAHAAGRALGDGFGRAVNATKERHGRPKVASDLTLRPIRAQIAQIKGLPTRALIDGRADFTMRASGRIYAR